MPTQPNEGGRDLERRASDGLDPENRAENAEHHATRRTVLSMVTGGIAATAAVGTASASKRPTVYAGSDSCGVIDLNYTSHGPTIAVEVHGDGLDEPYTRTLEAGGFDYVQGVPAGEYDVRARPAGANGGSSVPVDGTPITVKECTVSVSADIGCLTKDRGKLVIDNPLDTCVPVRWEAYRNGERQDSGSYHVPSKEHNSFPLYASEYDEWFFWAHLPPSSGDCWDTGGDTIQINEEPSPLHLKGEDCGSISPVEDG